MFLFAEMRLICSQKWCVIVRDVMRTSPRAQSILFRILLPIIYFWPLSQSPAQTVLRQFASDQNLRWLREYAVQIKSIEPNDANFSDLEPLKKILAGSKIVMLGEHSHGDGNIFLAKTRLIKFLHQEMNFDVIAFEASLYGCSKVWQEIQGGNDVDLIGKGLYKMWAKSKQCQPLFQYIMSEAKTERPLKLSGFDPRLASIAAFESFDKDLVSSLTLFNLHSIHKENLLLLRNFADSLLRNEFTFKPESHLKDQFFAVLSSVLEELDTTNSTNDIRKQLIVFWKQQLRSLRSLAIQHWSGNDLSIRDVQMADNLLWLERERYPNEKIICWGHNFHFARNVSDITLGDTAYPYKNYKTMGDSVWNAIGALSYVIDFTIDHGVEGSALEQPRTLEPSSTGSLEYIINTTGLSYAFIDFRSLPIEGKWLRNKFVSRVIGDSEKLADWTQCMDGLFFVRELQPSVGVDKR